MIHFLKSESSRHVRSPRGFYLIGIWLVLLFTTTILFMIFIPWQQTITGTGRVTVFSASERPQNLEAQISGRIKEWIVSEGQSVKKGQLIAELVDLDPKFLSATQIESLELQRTALLNRKAAAESRISALRNQEGALSQSRQAAVPGAGQRVSQNQQGLLAAKQNLEATRLNYQRVKELYDKGLRSKRDFELAELELVRSETGVNQASAQLNSSQFDQRKVSGDTSAAVANVSASIAAAYETIASVDNDIAKLTIEIENLKQRMEQRRIVSPINGKVVRLLQAGSGETVSEGEILATIVPDTADQAVELYVSAWDVPLLSEGRHVRLQFAGWPAIQFTGWPMIATGTFGGRVAVIDAVDDGTGKYRVLVKPDQITLGNRKDQPWPSPQFLRPGAEAQGWFLLDRVPLGFELWRQFNAFPPSLRSKPDEGDSANEKSAKPVKRKVKK